MDLRTKPSVGTKLLHAEGGGQARWDGQSKRAPKKGELFISGNPATAYRAVHDMSTAYFIATPANNELSVDLSTFAVAGKVRSDETPRDLLERIAGLAGAPADATPLQVAERAHQIMQLCADIIITTAVAEAALQSAANAAASQISHVGELV